jgi:hypothetical protein
MVVIGALAGAVGVSGCGGGGTKTSPATKAGQLADQVQHAASKGDAGKLCNDLFTASLRAFIKSRSRKPCDQAVKTSVIPAFSSFRIINVGVSTAATKATVTLIDKNGANDRLFLVRSGSGWKVNAILKPGIGRVQGTGGATKKKK